MLDQWQRVHLGDAVTRIQDKWPDRKKWHFDKYIAGRHIESGEVRIKNFGLIKEDEKVIGPAFHMRFKPKNVLYLARRAYLRKAGMVNFEGICSNVTLVLQADETKLLQSLLPFILQSEDFVQFAINHSIGSTNPFIKWTDLRKFEFMLPSVYEQKKISRIFWTIEENLEKVEDLIKSIGKLKKGLTRILFIQGIGHTKFKKTELGEIPKGWKVVTLGEVLDVCQYGLSQSLSEVGQYPIFRMNNIENGHMVNNNLKYTNLDAKTFQRFKLEKEDILFNRTNSIELVGKVGIFLHDGDFTFASYLIRLRSKKEMLNPYFLNFFLNDPINQQKLKNLATRAIGQSNINATNLKTFKIPIPVMHEQQKIASILSDVDELIQRLKEKKMITKTLKNNLIQKILTGKLRAKVNGND